MGIRLLKLCLAVLLSSSLVATSATPGKRKVWITVGDVAFEQVKILVPNAETIATGELGSAGDAAKIYAVALDESRLDAVAGAIHHRMGQCGGFMFHASEAEARAALAGPGLAEPGGPYAVNHRARVEPLLASMQEKNIEATILSLSGFANRYYMSQSGVDASNWLAQKWTEISAGRPDITVRQITHGNYRQQSVMVTIAGKDSPDEAVIVGAHLDSIVGFGMNEKSVAPGADDDASGVASMTEALRAMVEHSYKPKRSIHLIAYAAEEVGLRGSQEIARQFKQNSRKVAGVLQLDMTNYKGAANDIYLLTDFTDKAQNSFLEQLIATYLPGLKVGNDRCGYACSDHASWHAQGYPVSMPFESTFARDNPHIHTAKDTYVNSGSQSAHALKFARLAAAYLVELAGE